MLLTLLKNSISRKFGGIIYSWWVNTFRKVGKFPVELNTLEALIVLLDFLHRVDDGSKGALIFGKTDMKSPV
jgi:hypothetical protein